MALRRPGVFIGAARMAGANGAESLQKALRYSFCESEHNFSFFSSDARLGKKKVFWHLLQNLKRLMSRRKEQNIYLERSEI